MLECLDRLDTLDRRLDRALRPDPSEPKSASASSKLLERFAERYRGDYIGFTKLLEIDSRHGRVPFVLNPAQLAYDAARTPRDVILKGRRTGMTTEGVARDLWHLLTYEDTPSVTIVCQSITGHAPVLDIRKILVLFIESLRERGLPLEFSKETGTDWELAGRPGSLRIVEAGASKAAASKKGRAGRVTRLHCTELAFWEYAGETLNALVECVDRPDFEIEYESTANGAAGEDRSSPKDATGATMFHWAVQDAQRGTSGFRFHFFEWYQEPEYRTPLEPGEVVEPHTPRERQLVAAGIEPEQLKWYQRKLGEKKSQELVDQEYPSDPDTCFLLTGLGFFDGLRTAELLAQARDPIEARDVRERGMRGQVVGNAEIPALRIWHRPQAGCSYVLSLDTSEGTGGDAGAGILLERGTGRHMATLWGQFKPIELARAAVGVAVGYGNALIAVERNNHGHACIQALEAILRYPHIFRDTDEKLGWLTVETSRTVALDRLEQAHRAGHFASLDRFLLSEMRTFIVNERGKAEAAKGAHDDLVMATAIGWDVICRSVTRYNLTNLPPG